MRTACTSESRHRYTLHTERRVEWPKHGIPTHFPPTGMHDFGSISDTPFSQVSYSVLFVFYFICTTIFCLQSLSLSQPPARLAQISSCQFVSSFSRLLPTPGANTRYIFLKHRTDERNDSCNALSTLVIQE